MRVSDIPVGAVRDVCSAFASMGSSRRTGVRVTVVVGPGAPSGLVRALKGALVPETPYGLVHVEAPLVSGALVVNPDADLAVVCAGGQRQAAAYARALSEAGVPVAIAVESGLEAPEVFELADAPGVSLVAGSSPDVLLDKLAQWMADTCDARVALAASFAFCRRAVTMRLVHERSAQNAAIGLLPLGSAADMPVMAANQTLMALDVAASYGQGAGSERVAEALSIAAVALLARRASRLAVRSLPGLGWLVRATVAYGTTALLGHALVAAHELRGRARASGGLPVCPRAS